ncbi:UNVERIFIED_CONTAM: hypothetical protein GTU68_007294, partial [Idotea baltica]|nr:hypothetical protein [Idotea baltica]
DCIITALRSGNKECPTCRKKLVSKRSLRPDPNFDTLISKIYPSRDEYEQHQERVLANLHKNHNHASLINSIEEGIKLQSQNRQKPSSATNTSTTNTSTNNNGNSNCSSASSFSGPKPKKARISNTGATSENESGAGSSVEGNAGDDGDGPNDSSTKMNEENELIRELKDSSIRYIKTTANATVDHLSKYLAMRLTLATRTGELETELPSSLNNFCIYIAPTPDQYIVLSGSLTLEQVNEKYWRVNKPMEMFYSWKKN